MYSITEQMVAWLAALGFKASTYPDKSGAECVTVERTGGNVDSFADHPMMAVQAWAATETRAEEMAMQVRNAALVGPWPSGVTAMRVNSGPYRYNDPDTRRPRYQLVLDVTCISID